jgi:hypothetical protein
MIQNLRMSNHRAVINEQPKKECNIGIILPSLQSINPWLTAFLHWISPFSTRGLMRYPITNGGGFSGADARVQ